MAFHDAYMVACALSDVITERVEEAFEVFAEHGLDVARADTFADCGVLTRDAGFVITLADGAEYQVTVVRSR
jgi:hypothetical protein